MENNIGLGIPTGSSLKKDRGNLKYYIDKTGIDCKYLGERKPPEITNIPWLKAFIGRPQELPIFAQMGYIDAFFCGDDWVRECELQGIYNEKLYNEKLVGLGTGKVDIVVAGIYGALTKRQIKVASEYPYIARDFFSKFDDRPIPIVSFGEMIPEEGIIIIRSAGITEAKAYYGLVEFIVDAKQNGDTLENFKISAKELIMKSEISLYYNRRIAGNKDKMERVRELELMVRNSLGYSTITNNHEKTEEIRDDRATVMLDGRSLE